MAGAQDVAGWVAAIAKGDQVKNDTIEKMARPGLDLMDQVIAEHKPSHVFGMFSGGHDSYCACHVASQHPRFSGCVNIDTQIGVEETRQFVRERCEHHGWPLKVYAPPMPKFALDNPERYGRCKTAYEACVVRWGFPGPAGHTLIYNRLKERCIRAVVRDHKQHRKDRILLITGVRLSESARRSRTGQASGREGCRVWCATILSWGDYDKAEYMTAAQMGRNDVVDTLCMSGECLCGAFAKPGEFADVKKFYPSTAAQIEHTQDLAREAGVHCVWGTRPPKTPKCAKTAAVGGMELCHSCHAQLDKYEDAFGHIEPASYETNAERLIERRDAYLAAAAEKKEQK